MAAAATRSRACSSTVRTDHAPPRTSGHAGSPARRKGSNGMLSAASPGSMGHGTPHPSATSTGAASAKSSQSPRTSVSSGSRCALAESPSLRSAASTPSSTSGKSCGAFSAGAGRPALAASASHSSATGVLKRMDQLRSSGPETGNGKGVASSTQKRAMSRSSRMQWRSPHHEWFPHAGRPPGASSHSETSPKCGRRTPPWAPGSSAVSPRSAMTRSSCDTGTGAIPPTGPPRLATIAAGGTSTRRHPWTAATWRCPPVNETVDPPATAPSCTVYAAVQVRDRRRPGSAAAEQGTGSNATDRVRPGSAANGRYR